MTTIASAHASAGSARQMPATRTPNACASVPSTRLASGRSPRNATLQSAMIRPRCELLDPELELRSSPTCSRRGSRSRRRQDDVADQNRARGRTRRSRRRRASASPPCAVRDPVDATGEHECRQHRACAEDADHVARLSCPPSPKAWANAGDSVLIGVGREPDRRDDEQQRDRRGRSRTKRRLARRCDSSRVNVRPRRGWTTSRPATSARYDSGVDRERGRDPERVHGHRGEDGPTRARGCTSSSSVPTAERRSCRSRARRSARPTPARRKRPRRRGRARTGSRPHLREPRPREQCECAAHTAVATSCVATSSRRRSKRSAASPVHGASRAPA